MKVAHFINYEAPPLVKEKSKASAYGALASLRSKSQTSGGIQVVSRANQGIIKAVEVGVETPSMVNAGSQAVDIKDILLAQLH